MTNPHLVSVFFSLEGEIVLSLGQASEREELNHIKPEEEETLRNLESETVKLVRRYLEKDCVMHLASVSCCSLIPWGSSSMVLAMSGEIS